MGMVASVVMESGWLGLAFGFGVFGAILVLFVLGMLYWASRQSGVRIAAPDVKAFLYQFTEVVGRSGFKRTDAADGSYHFYAPLQKLMGAPPLRLTFDQGGYAHITALARVMRRVRPVLPGAEDEPFTGPSAFGRFVKTYLTLCVMIVGPVVVIILVFFRGTLTGGVSEADRHKLDVTMPVTVSAADAAEGTYVQMVVPMTGKPMPLHIPAQSTEGSRVVFTGYGRLPAEGPSGDLILVVHISK